MCYYLTEYDMKPRFICRFFETFDEQINSLSLITIFNNLPFFVFCSRSSCLLQLYLQPGFMIQHCRIVSRLFYCFNEDCIVFFSCAHTNCLKLAEQIKPLKHLTWSAVRKSQTLYVQQILGVFWGGGDPNKNLKYNEQVIEIPGLYMHAI